MTAPKPRVKPAKAAKAPAPPAAPEPQDPNDAPVIRMAAPPAAPPADATTRVQIIKRVQQVPDTPQTPPARVRVRVNVGHDGRRRGAQLDLELTAKEQRLIDRGYLQLLGTLDPSVPPYVATYPPTP